jgi:hypothetical protein
MIARAANQDLALTRVTKFRPAEPFTLAGTRAALAVIVAVSAAGVATLSTAQTVPVPKPAPKAASKPTFIVSEEARPKQFWIPFPCSISIVPRSSA